MAYREYIHTPVTVHDMGWGLRQGAIAGIVAGVVFAAFEMLAAGFMMGAEAFFMPLRMIGAIALGPEALDPAYSLLTAATAGVIVHVILSVIYGIIFGEIATVLRGSTAFIVAASVFGLALWLVNFYVIAPAAFPWFLDSSPLVQFIGHTFFFGTVLGIYLWTSHESSGLEGPAE
jgi:ABC-type nitrate/sulfonate/bicarbonate transport system permease component